MNSLTTERIAPGDIRTLKPLLTRLQQNILNLRSIEESDADVATLLSIKLAVLKRELRRVRRLLSLCKEAVSDIQRLKQSLLGAPVEILQLTQQTNSTLRGSGIDYIADFYKQEMTILSLQRKVGIGESLRISWSLRAIDLPRLDQITPTAAIYGFFDPNKRKTLTDRHKVLLRQWTWGNTDKRTVSNCIDMAPGHFSQLEAHLRRRLRVR